MHLATFLPIITFIFQTCNGLTFNYLYYPEEGLFDRPKYWLSLFISSYIFGFLFVVWRWFFFTSLLSTSTPVSSLRFIDLDPAAVLVPVAFFFYILAMEWQEWIDQSKTARTNSQNNVTRVKIVTCIVMGGRYQISQTMAQLVTMLRIYCAIGSFREFQNALPNVESYCKR